MRAASDNGLPAPIRPETAISPLSEDLTTLIRETTPKIVGLRVHRRGYGSGVIVRSGFVVTSAHVVGQRSEVVVRYSDGLVDAAMVRGMDRLTDLAVLQVNNRNEPGLVWGDSEVLQPGQLVITVSTPMGLDGTASLGIVSSTHRRLNLGGRIWLDGVLQTDAAVAPGSSGGALMTTTGRLVGIIAANNMRHSGLAFAIPSATVEWVVSQLMDDGHVRRSHLGLRLQTVQLPAKFEFRSAYPRNRRCVLVRDIVPDHPGDLAGLRAGDLLLSANARPLDGVHLVQRYLGIKSVGREVVVDFVRDGRLMRTGLIPAIRGEHGQGGQPG